MSLTYASYLHLDELLSFGSLGVDLLKKSLFHPVFPELWAIRNKL